MNKVAKPKNDDDLVHVATLDGENSWAKAMKEMVAAQIEGVAITISKSIRGAAKIGISRAALERNPQASETFRKLKTELKRKGLTVAGRSYAQGSGSGPND